MLLFPPEHPRRGLMASDRAGSEASSPGDALLEDIVMAERADATAEAIAAERPASAAASSQAKPEASAQAVPQAASRPAKTKRARKPDIDLDAAIRDAATAMKAAQKKVQEAKTQAKNERRKKQRLLKKAATLNAEDLERIAVLKRCGWLVTSSGGSATGDAASGCSASEAASSEAPLAPTAASSGSNPESRA